MTVADFTVQAIVLGVLERYFPHHGFIAEETSSVLAQDQASLSRVLSVVSTVLGRAGLTEAELCAAIDLGARGHGKPNPKYHWGKGGRTFVLDPIDGTKGFLRGEQFCVALVSVARGQRRGFRWVGGLKLLPLVVSCRHQLWMGVSAMVLCLLTGCRWVRYRTGVSHCFEGRIGSLS